MLATSPPVFDVAKRTAAEAETRLFGLLTRAGSRFRLAFMRTVAGIENVWTLDLLANLLEQGQMERALETARLNAGHLGQAGSQTFVMAGEAAADLVGEGLGIDLDFNQVNTRAVQMMQNNSLRLIRQFTQDQRDAVRVALTQGITEGINPVDQARAIRGVIGLTGRQARAVSNYRQLLEMGSGEALTRALRDRRFDPSVLRSIESGRALTPDAIDNMVERYRQRYLKYRSEVIARTESLRSVHEGQQEAFRQARDTERLAGFKVVRRWVTAHDDRVRDSHAAMDGQEVGMDEPFITGNGESIMYPGDPSAPPEEVIQCRCVVTTRLVKE